MTSTGIFPGAIFRSRCSVIAVESAGGAVTLSGGGGTTAPRPKGRELALIRSPFQPEIVPVPQPRLIHHRQVHHAALHPDGEVALKAGEFPAEFVNVGSKRAALPVCRVQP